jgi:hypothetical protein
MFRRAAFAAAFLLAVGCPLGDLLDGAPTDGGLPDTGSTSPGDAAVDDALADAGSDAGFCATQPGPVVFCDDFDTLDLAVAWTSRFLQGASVDRDPYDAAPSPPNTLLVQTPGVDASSGPRLGYIAKTIEGNFQHLEVSFWLLVEADDLSDAIIPVRILVPSASPPAYQSIDFYMFATRAYPAEFAIQSDGGFAGYQLGDLFASPRVGIKTVISITIDLNPDAGPPTLTVREDGTVQGYYPASLRLPGWKLGPKVEVRLGATLYGPNASGWRLRFDDVVVRGQ